MDTEGTLPKSHIDDFDDGFGNFRRALSSTPLEESDAAPSWNYSSSMFARGFEESIF